MYGCEHSPLPSTLSLHFLSVSPLTQLGSCSKGLGKSQSLSKSLAESSLWLLLPPLFYLLKYYKSWGCFLRSQCGSCFAAGVLDSGVEILCYGTYSVPWSDNLAFIGPPGTRGLNQVLYVKSHYLLILIKLSLLPGLPRDQDRKLHYMRLLTTKKMLKESRIWRVLVRAINRDHESKSNFTRFILGFGMIPASAFLLFIF